MTFSAGTRVHIVGVGGAGMSALAILLKEAGCVLSGCDRENAAVLDDLARRGVEVATSHDPRHVEDVDVVLWSPAVRPEHVELVAARAAPCVMMARPQVLAELSRTMSMVGVTGTHGKTTATSMLVCVMAAAGRDDSRLVGAPVRTVGAGGHFGDGVLLCEIDESYGAFSELTPAALGLLNVEADHLDHYGTLERLESAFAEVLERTSGPVVVWSDDPGATRVAALARREVVRVGTSHADWLVSDVDVSAHGEILAHARLRGEVEMEIALRVPGRHNVANAAVVAVLALSLGVDRVDVARGLGEFRGAPRRFDVVGRWRGASVVDDYAHLPGEIAATVAAARSLGYERIAAIFQPHRVTRTLALAADYAAAFDGLSCVIVTDIYRAGEDNPSGVDGEVVARPLRERGRVATHYAPSLAQAARALELEAPDADLVLVLGAGDVTRVLEHLEIRASDDEVPRDVATPHFWGEDPRVLYDAPLGARTTYRVGGSVAALVTLNSMADLDELCAELKESTRPLWVVGNGSNLLVADGRHDVVAVHLTGEFEELVVRDEGDDIVSVRAGGGLDLPIAARRLAGEGVVGFEWAVGVPGTFGGAVAMNAGGHGSDMKASVVRAEVWSRGERVWRDARELDFSYRHSAVAPGEIVTRVEVRLRRGDAAASKEAISQIVRWRREHQPGGANAGSVFRNPEGDSAGRLIEAAGLKGARVGSARISEKHANFIIVDPDGTAGDVARLMGLVRRRVVEASGVVLESEHRLLGFEAP